MVRMASCLGLAVTKMAATNSGAHFTFKLVDDLFASFAEHGPGAIARVRTERPLDYLRIIAALVPKQLELKAAAFDGLPDGDLADLVSSMSAL